MQNKVGVNEDALNKLILDIYNYSERITKTLDQISSVVDQTKNFYICEEATDYRNKFNIFKNNFPIVSKNIVSYADDLLKVKRRFDLMDQNAASQVKSTTSNMNYENFKG